MRWFAGETSLRWSWTSSLIRRKKKIHELGWLALVKEQSLENHELHVQLKLVNPDSEEAKDLP